MGPWKAGLASWSGSLRGSQGPWGRPPCAYQLPLSLQPNPKVQGLMHHWLGAVVQGLQQSEGWCSRNPINSRGKSLPPLSSFLNPVGLCPLPEHPTPPKHYSSLPFIKREQVTVSEPETW